MIYFYLFMFDSITYQYHEAVGLSIIYRAISSQTQQRFMCKNAPYFIFLTVKFQIS